VCSPRGSESKPGAPKSCGWIYPHAALARIPVAPGKLIGWIAALAHAGDADAGLVGHRALVLAGASAHALLRVQIRQLDRNLLSIGVDHRRFLLPDH
jgi:hypothetical protein